MQTAPILPTTPQMELLWDKIPQVRANLIEVLASSFLAPEEQRFIPNLSGTRIYLASSLTGKIFFLCFKIKAFVFHLFGEKNCLFLEEQVGQLIKKTEEDLNLLLNTFKKGLQELEAHPDQKWSKEFVPKIKPLLYALNPILEQLKTYSFPPTSLFLQSFPSINEENITFLEEKFYYIQEQAIFKKAPLKTLKKSSKDLTLEDGLALEKWLSEIHAYLQNHPSSSLERGFSVFFKENLERETKRTFAQFQAFLVSKGLTIFFKKEESQIAWRNSLKEGDSFSLPFYPSVVLHQRLGLKENMDEDVIHTYSLKESPFLLKIPQNKHVTTFLPYLEELSSLIQPEEIVATDPLHRFFIVRKHSLFLEGPWKLEEDKSKIDLFAHFLKWMVDNCKSSVNFRPDRLYISSDFQLISSEYIQPYPKLSIFQIEKLVHEISQGNLEVKKKLIDFCGLYKTTSALFFKEITQSFIEKFKLDCFEDNFIYFPSRNHLGPEPDPFVYREGEELIETLKTQLQFYLTTHSFEDAKKELEKKINENYILLYF